MRYLARPNSRTSIFAALRARVGPRHLLVDFKSGDADQRVQSRVVQQDTAVDQSRREVVLGGHRRLTNVRGRAGVVAARAARSGTGHAHPDGRNAIGRALLFTGDRRRDRGLSKVSGGRFVIDGQDAGLSLKERNPGGRREVLSRGVYMRSGGLLVHPLDPLPVDVEHLAPPTLVGEVVLKKEITPLLAEARARGCPIQVATDMLFEMIPAYLEFFGFGTTTPEELRAIAKIVY